MERLIVARIGIPEDIEFADLRLARDADGMVSFVWAVIERICAASGVDVELFRTGPEDYVSELIVTWYMRHRAAGGGLDATAEDLIEEARLEDAAGSQSYPPGLA